MKLSARPWKSFAVLLLVISLVLVIAGVYLLNHIYDSGPCIGNAVTHEVSCSVAMDYSSLELGLTLVGLAIILTGWALFSMGRH